VISLRVTEFRKKVILFTDYIIIMEPISKRLYGPAN